MSARKEKPDWVEVTELGSAYLDETEYEGTHLVSNYTEVTVTDLMNEEWLREVFKKRSTSRSPEGRFRITVEFWENK